MNIKDKVAIVTGASSELVGNRQTSFQKWRKSSAGGAFKRKTGKTF